MDFTYKFGKTQQSEIILSCEDILNTSNMVLNLVFDDYVMMKRDTVFGRSLTLSYKYTFR